MRQDYSDGGTQAGSGFGPILHIVLDVRVFQIPVGNPAFFTTFPVSWEETRAHTTTVLGHGGAG